MAFKTRAKVRGCETDARDARGCETRRKREEERLAKSRETRRSEEGVRPVGRRGRC